MELVGVGLAGLLAIMMAGFFAGCFVLGLLLLIGKVFVGLVKFAFGLVLFVVLLGIFGPILLPLLFAITIPALVLAPIFFVFLFIPIAIGLALIKGLFAVIFC